MFDTKKFGIFLSSLRKKADMTQSEVAIKLNVTRQAVSHYECGDTFPDVSILVNIANLFNISLDELIRSGEPSTGEALILRSGECSRTGIFNRCAACRDCASGKR